MKTHIILTFAFVFLFILACKKNDSTPSSSSSSVPEVFKKFSSSVEIYAEGDFIVLKTKDVPNHKSPYWGSSSANYETPQSGMTVNPNSIKEQNYVLKIPKNPKENTSSAATPLDAIGIAVNGVVLFNQYAGPNQPLDNEIKTFDRYNGHPAIQNNYHYHIEPKYITNNDANLVGFLLDGFPVYGKKDADGTTPVLDANNGHFGVTPDYPNGIYHYHITDNAPYICGGYKGTKGTVTN
jgi:hypothetical protein